MADRRLVQYEEQRLADGPHFTLIVDRSAAGPPGGLVTIHYRSVDGTLPEQQLTVVMDDLRRLQPALDWANGYPEAAETRIASLETALRRVREMAAASRYVHGTTLALYLDHYLNPDQGSDHD